MRGKASHNVLTEIRSQFRGRKSSSPANNCWALGQFKHRPTVMGREGSEIVLWVWGVFLFDFFISLFDLLSFPQDQRKYKGQSTPCLVAIVASQPWPASTRNWIIKFLKASRKCVQAHRSSQFPNAHINSAHMSHFAPRNAGSTQGAAKQTALADRIQAAVASVRLPWDTLPQHW